MKAKRLVLYLGSLAVLCSTACKEKKPVVTPLAIDLPASYRSDSAAYFFILHQVEVWNGFGTKIESLYLQGEKFRKMDFASLSKRQEYNLLKLDLEYALLWEAQDAYLDKMIAEAEWIMKDASLQGAAKVTETQKLVLDYYRDLVQHFGTDLQLDQTPLPIDSLKNRPEDPNQAELDSLLLEKLMPSPFPFRDSLPESGTR